MVCSPQVDGQGHALRDCPGTPVLIGVNVDYRGNAGLFTDVNKRTFLELR